MKKNPLFKLCSKEWYTIIEQNQRISEIKQKNHIFSQNEPVKRIYFILKGKVKVVSSNDKDVERIHRLAGEGKLLGHRGFAAKYYPVSAVALTNTTVAFIPNVIFIKLIKTNPKLSIYLINFLTEELRETEERMKNTLRLEVKHRIARILVDLTVSFGFDSKDPEKLNHALSRKEFANMAGTTYETVIRILAYLQRRKLIKLAGKSIYIRNIKGLKNLP